MSADVRAFIELMRPKNMVLAAITVPLGALFGLNASLNEEQLIAVIIQIFSVLAFMGAGNAMNDIKDAAIDAQAHPNRPLPSQRISLEAAKKFVVVLWLISFSLMAVGAYLLMQSDATWWPLAVIYIAAVALMLTYDLGPETKTKGLIGNVSISLMVAAVILYGAATVDSITRLSFLVAGVVFFTNLAREIVKDCQDMLADEGERYTLPMKVGLERARMLAYVFIMGGLVCLYIPYWQGPFVFGQLLLQTPAIMVLITLNGPLFKGEDVQVSSRIRVAMLLGLMSFILTMYL
ncbi:MAG: geranylgeranylglycerol-phosphate geranylgeranyltransferase [Euryarchaeota archaeon]|jgi:geranylgeranylglycerol-phosphate geranylgeranyltransferase|nr:geranylgeranylglycerol-phosphate geranylgeranyltransferase [Euryarchaeota archaeon]MBT6255010.1 geranylgeranylglycerol-phosphate geranylgeranyltransferase [Euryarchaeota archaeon]MBT6528279.1 geranylgeranylglycerol-phosphate geranylgeranyltransferase [Euryarchaeota archaeon]MBT7961721.1 geranylgeranylglycerol-phosphate geranylgeranyltransferase [Euryarchaeota archaeon]